MVTRYMLELYGDISRGVTSAHYVTFHYIVVVTHYMLVLYTCCYMLVLYSCCYMLVLTVDRSLSHVDL